MWLGVFVNLRLHLKSVECVGSAIAKIRLGRKNVCGWYRYSEYRRSNVCLTIYSQSGFSIK